MMAEVYNNYCWYRECLCQISEVVVADFSSDTPLNNFSHDSSVSEESSSNSSFNFAYPSSSSSFSFALPEKSELIGTRHSLPFDG